MESTSRTFWYQMIIVSQVWVCLTGQRWKYKARQYLSLVPRRSLTAYALFRYWLDGIPCKRILTCACEYVDRISVTIPTRTTPYRLWKASRFHSSSLDTSILFSRKYVILMLCVTLQAVRFMNLFYCTVVVYCTLFMWCLFSISVMESFCSYRILQLIVFISTCNLVTAIHNKQMNT